MNWEAIAAVGETIGALAVCVTLIFLTFQLRQSNKAQKSTAYQTYLATRTKLQESLLNPAVNSALLAGSFDPAQTDDEGLQRYHQVMHLCMTYFSSSFRLWKDGLLSNEEWESNRSMIAEFKGTEGFKLWWPAVNTAFYNANFVAEIDRSRADNRGLERFLTIVRSSRRESRHVAIGASHH